MAWPESKGSIASAPIQCPMWSPTYGAPDASRTDLSPSAFQVAPPSVERNSSSDGHQRSMVVTITVPGRCGSTASPAKPKPLPGIGEMSFHAPLEGVYFHTEPALMPFGPG